MRKTLLEINLNWYLNYETVGANFNKIVNRWTNGYECNMQCILQKHVKPRHRRVPQENNLLFPLQKKKVF